MNGLDLSWHHHPFPPIDDIAERYPVEHVD
jgi:hypothetical protein